MLLGNILDMHRGMRVPSFPSSPSPPPLFPLYHVSGLELVPTYLMGTDKVALRGYLTPSRDEIFTRNPVVIEHYKPV